MEQDQEEKVPGQVEKEGQQVTRAAAPAEAEVPVEAAFARVAEQRAPIRQEALALNKNVPNVELP
ncbi:MAG: hypothetical protein JRD47_06265 [Deltaproteobacteria bacterium]|nr:hypothetical protein [Deltaproteobacteria bacterium]